MKKLKVDNLIKLRKLVGKTKPQKPKNEAEQVVFNIEYALELGKLTPKEKFIKDLVVEYVTKHCK